MSPAEARQLLIPENIKTTALVLAALDVIQGHEFDTSIGPRLRKVRPHSESELLERGRKAIEGFAYNSLPGNGCGLKMNLSAFLNGLKLARMPSQLGDATQSLIEFEKTSEEPT